MITTQTITITRHRWTPKLTLVEQFSKDFQEGQFLGINEVTISPKVYDLFMEEARTRFFATGPEPEDAMLYGIRLIKGVL